MSPFSIARRRLFVAAKAFRRQHNYPSSFSTKSKDPTATVLAHILRENVKSNAPDATFLFSGNGNRMSHERFCESAFAFARALLDLEYANASANRENKPLAVRLGDSPELLIALTGALLAGVKVESAKTKGEFLEVKSFGSLVHADLASAAGGMIGAHEPIAVGEAGLKEKVVHWDVLMHAYGRREEDEKEDSILSSSSGREALFYFNSSEKGDGAETLFGYGEQAAKAMELGRGDVVMVGVPMLHAMGFGFGALGAMMAGARIMVPGTCDGVVDDSVKIDRAGNVKKALMSSISASSGSNDDDSDDGMVTAMVSDMHIVKALREEDANRALLKNVRTGLVKVGGGAGVGEHAPVDMLGVPLVTVGKMK
jgi:acyl-CoA synthetase (AMP-forming)/AMP-acid ligase II